MKSKKYILIVCAAVLVALTVALNVTLGCLNSAIGVALSKPEIKLSERLEGQALAEQIEEEGIVLVKNQNNCLPLSETDVTNGQNRCVNVFGWASIDWLSGGAGSGRCVQAVDIFKPKTGLLEALRGYKVFSQNGVIPNPDLVDFYRDFSSGRAAASRDTLNSHDYESCVLYEPAMDAYGDELLAGAKQYSKVALAVVGRISGESNDAPKVQYKFNAETDQTRTYLDVSVEEENLLAYLGRNYEKVVVIVNSTNAVNLEFLDRIPGISACLLVGGTGVDAATAIPNVLFGKKLAEDGKTMVSVSPSGRTTDTYVYDFKSNPNFVYSGIDGVSFYQNAPSDAYPLNVKNSNVGVSENYPGVGYVDYAEGIYVGYKWYETANAEGYFDSVDNVYGKGYDGVVQYPFGFGLSYSEFAWTVQNWTVKNGKISVGVIVKNVGNVPAKEVVQLYYNPPYVKGGVEKSAVNLCAFAKTATDVNPGESRLLTLSLNLFDMASYDQNRNGGKFVLEKGIYELSLRTDAHNLKEVDGKGIFNYKVSSDVVYDSYVGTNGTQKISNLFGSDGLKTRISADGLDTEADISQVWLSRSDFATTFRTEKQPARNWNSALTSTNAYSAGAAANDDEIWAATHQTDVTFGDDSDVKLFENKNFTEWAYVFGNPENYDAAEWEILLDEITLAEAENLVLHSHLHEEALPSVGKPRTVSVDGPAQVGSFYQSPIATGYPCATVLAQTWNVDLFETFGLSLAKDAKDTGRDGLYAPGVNIHRSAFGGRNYEYYSEDPYLSGMAAGSVVRGALNGGVYTYVKHFVCNDQESYRDGVYCWLTEQTLRETYLAPFKRVIDMGATGLMSSYSRIGSVWAGGNKQLLTDLLRNEWGFKGTVITDYSDHHEYMNGDQMLRAGGDLWMDGDRANGTLKFSKDSAAFNSMLRLATKHVLYTWTNAAYEKQQYSSEQHPVQEFLPTQTFAWWWVVATVASLAMIGGSTAIFLVIFKKKPQQNQE